MALTVELNRRRKRSVSKPMAHTDYGWPHLSSTAPHHCMCLEICCQDEQGCRCKGCVCKLGIPHGEKTNAA